jgi:hypothetical protein
LANGQIQSPLSQFTQQSTDTNAAGMGLVAAFEFGYAICISWSPSMRSMAPGFFHRIFGEITGRNGDNH